MLASPAAGEVAVEISSEMSSEGVISHPNTVVIPAGQTEVEFNVIGMAPGSGEITATLNGNSLVADLTVLNPNDF